MFLFPVKIDFFSLFSVVLPGKENIGGGTGQQERNGEKGDISGEKGEKNS